MSNGDIPSWLKDATYEKLFMQGEAASVLARPVVEAELSQVLAAEGVEPASLVLAHELLVEAGQPARPRLAEAYCRALPESFLHNWWGMPGQYLERLGHTMVSFGEAAIPCLTRLLDDTRPLGYFGSEEPTLSQQMQYRVCDLAAYLLAAIKGVPYVDAEQPDARDRLIGELRRRISE
jgi:hypothetical protein